MAHTNHGDNIYLIEDVQAPDPQQLTQWTRSQVSPSWNPQGTYIAFYSNHDFIDRVDLYVMQIGSQPYAVAHGVVKSHNGPSWTPDGESLIYIRDDEQAFDPVYRVPIINPDLATLVPTQTVGNGDLDVVLGTDGQTWLAVSAQGLENDAVRDFKRIYVMPIP